MLITKENTFRFLGIVALHLVIVAFVSSCDQTKRPVRPQTKTLQNVVTPATSSQASQQAAAQNANYDVYSISLPVAATSGNGYTVNIEMRTPSGEVLPFSTTHINGQLEIQGLYTDSQRGLQVYFQASCSSSNCDKYMLLTTVYRGNQVVYQTFAVSYVNDCTISVSKASGSYGSFYQNLYAADTATNIRPINDAADGICE